MKKRKYFTFDLWVDHCDCKFYKIPLKLEELICENYYILDTVMGALVDEFSAATIIDNPIQHFTRSVKMAGETVVPKCSMIR